MEDRNGGVSVWGWEVADSRLKLIHFLFRIYSLEKPILASAGFVI